MPWYGGCASRLASRPRWGYAGPVLDSTGAKLVAVVVLAALAIGAPAAFARKPVIAYVDAGTKKLQFYDPEQGRNVLAPNLTIPGIRGFAMSFDGRYVFYRDGEPGTDYKLHLFDRATSAEVSLPGIDVYTGADKPIDLSVSNTGLLAFDDNGNGPAVVYDSRPRSFVETGLGAGNGHRQSHLSGDGKFLATTCVTGSMNCVVESGGSDADAFVQNLTTKVDTGFPDDLNGADKSEEHPCINGDGSVVGVDIGNPVQRDLFFYDRARSMEVSFSGLNDPVVDDVRCVLDAAGDYIGLDDNAGNFKVYERASSSFLDLSGVPITTPAWFTAPYSPPKPAAKKPPAGGPPAGGPGTFGTRTRVTLKLAAKRIPARGPLKVRVANANGFEVTGKLSGQTVNSVSVSRKRRVKLRAKSFRVAPHARKTVKLKLPKALRRLLKRKHKLKLRLTAKLKDPAGDTRTVKKRVTPKLKKKRRR